MAQDRQTVSRPVVAGPIVIKNHLTSYAFACNELLEVPNVLQGRLGEWVAGYLDRGNRRIVMAGSSPVHDITRVVDTTVYMVCVGFVQPDHLFHARLGKLNYDTFENIILRNFTIGDSIRFMVRFCDFRCKFVLIKVLEQMDKSPLLKSVALEFCGSDVLPMRSWEENIFEDQALPSLVARFPLGSNVNDVPVTNSTITDQFSKSYAKCVRDEASSTGGTEGGKPNTATMWSIVKKTADDLYEMSLEMEMRPPPGKDESISTNVSAQSGVARGARGTLTHFTVGEHGPSDDIPDHFKPKMDLRGAEVAVSDDDSEKSVATAKQTDGPVGKISGEVKGITKQKTEVAKPKRVVIKPESEVITRRVPHDFMHRRMAESKKVESRYKTKYDFSGGLQGGEFFGNTGKPWFRRPKTDDSAAKEKTPKSSDKSDGDSEK
uniref:Uncharacterized protein n=2 Tax=Panagrolaimus sp. JU765 TaxID=591449 RepID=A0AC34QTL8_9BILA